MDEEVTELLDKINQEREAKIAEHKKHLESPEYVSQLDRLKQITFDFISALKSCSVICTRHMEFLQDSAFMRSIDDFLQSAVIIQFILEQGGMNPAKRELRYMLDWGMKSLYLDQEMPKSNLQAKIVYFDRKVDKSSISPLKNLKLFFFRDGYEKEYWRAFTKAYSTTCEYVHPSTKQIQERIRLYDEGITIGFDTAKQLEEANDLVFEVYGILLVLAFHAIGPSFSGDLLVGCLDENESWAYHSSPHLAKVDEYFDYKHERQDRLQEIRQKRKERLRG